MKWLADLWFRFWHRELGKGSISSWVVGEDGKPMCIDSEGVTQYEPRFKKVWRVQ